MTNAQPPVGQDYSREFSSWIGRSISVEDEVTLPAVRRMAAMLDLDPATFDQGSEIPPHWYSMFFTPNARRSQLGHDGHPKKGDFLPPIPLPRRMFVGRKASFPGALKVGDRALKQSEIVGIEQKHGRSGTLVFLKVKHTISVSGQPRVIEQQEVVYRDAPSVEAKTSLETPAPSDGVWCATQQMDPVLVFRYSALTWNGHRIHYDSDYARSEEGYPGCVMNGALTVHLVIDEALKQVGERKLKSLTARMVKPLFVGGALNMGGRSFSGNSMDAWASDEQGALAAICNLEFEEQP